MVDHENELQAFDSSGDSHDYPKNSVNSIMKANKVDRVVDIPDSVTRNPAMDRVQSALKAQLARTRDRIHRQFQEQQHGFWEAKKEREDCGVELYGMQQQLAQVQNQLDDTGDQHGSLMNNRQGAEEKFIHLRDEVKIRSSKRDKLKKKSSKRQEELDEVDSTLKQAEKFNQETKNEVAVTKTVASKAEEIVKGAEKGKEAQDVYIDGLNQQTKHLETETKWATKQLAIQRNQTEETDKVIKELAIELEVLSSEKKRLVQQWNSAILALGRRDQALGAVTKAMKEANDNSKDHTNEMIGLSRQSFNISLELEKVMFERNKIENELEFLEASIAKTRSDQESFASQQELISKIITNTQEDEAHEERQAKEQLSNATSLGHKIEGVSRERRELEDRIATYRGEQASISVAAKNLIKQENVLATKIHEKDIEAGSLENELARVKIDILNTTVHCSQLKDKLFNETDALEDKNKLISNMGVAIKRSHDDIGSKMNKVDRLNRKYEQMLDGVDEEEPMGPLEATIKSTEKEIAKFDEQARTLQAEWVSGQTQLIRTIGATEKSEVENRQKGAKLTILKQKRLRLLQEIHSNEAVLKVIESRIKGMHTDMSRLNELIGKYSQMRTKLANDNAVKEMEVSKEIVELERKTHEIEVKTAKVKVERDELLQEIMDAEKEILLWEKKIKLEKETQAALNSSEHAIEINGMEKEIHRMRHTLEEMNRKQETMIREMEFAINKREDIAVKYQNTKHGQATKTIATTFADARKKKTEMKRQKMAHEKETAMVLSKLAEMKGKCEVSKANASSISVEVELETEHHQRLQSEINNMFFEKQRLLAKSTHLHELLRKYNSLQHGDVLDHQTQQIPVQKRITIINGKMAKLLNAIAGLRIQLARYDDVFDRVNTLASDIEDVQTSEEKH